MLHQLRPGAFRLASGWAANFFAVAIVVHDILT
jgi:hypothetical protein